MFTLSPYKLVFVLSPFLQYICLLRTCVLISACRQHCVERACLIVSSTHVLSLFFGGLAIGLSLACCNFSLSVKTTPSTSGEDGAVNEGRGSIGRYANCRT